MANTVVWSGPLVLCIVKRRRRNFRDWVGVECVCMDAGLEKLNIICRRKDECRKKVPIGRSHMVKQFGKAVCSINI